MIKTILLGVPVIIGMILIIIGAGLVIRRTRTGIQTEGVVIGRSKYSRKLHKIDTEMEAPIVKYTVQGKEYTNTAAKYKMMGTGDDLEKGDRVRIRVDRKDHRKFTLTESGGLAELILIAGGVFMIIAYTVLMVRYY